MKNALIDPNSPVQAVTSWEYDVATQTYMPVFTNIPDSGRVCEISDSAFPVAPPFFWVNCSDNAQSQLWYCNLLTNEVLQVPPPVLKPVAENQPVVSGAQTL